MLEQVKAFAKRWGCAEVIAAPDIYRELFASITAGPFSDRTYYGTPIHYYGDEGSFIVRLHRSVPHGTMYAIPRDRDRAPLHPAWSDDMREIL